MDYNRFFQAIQFPEEAQVCVMDYSISTQEYLKWKQLFEDNSEMFFQQIQNTKNKDALLMYLYVNFAMEKYPVYMKKNIPFEVYIANFYDYTLWCNRCYHMHGKYGFTEARWLALPLQFKVFRLGRLHFEPIFLEEDLVCSHGVYKKGTAMLNVHISEGDSFNEEACLQSFSLAENFFGHSFSGYICTSWLLSPILQGWLKNDSNIMRFQALFDICHVDFSLLKGEERIFGKYKLLTQCEEVKTSLQQHAETYIQGGNRIGVGTGIRKRG